jgi:hypothetical protein
MWTAYPTAFLGSQKGFKSKDTQSTMLSGKVPVTHGDLEIFKDKTL